MLLTALGQEDKTPIPPCFIKSHVFISLPLLQETKFLLRLKKSLFYEILKNSKRLQVKFLINLLDLLGIDFRIQY